MEKAKLKRSDELDDYIRQAIEAAEYGVKEAVTYAVFCMTHKDFSNSKFVFDLTKCNVIPPEEVRETIQTAIKKITSANFKKKVSFLMP